MYIKFSKKYKGKSDGVDAASLVRVSTVLFVLCRYRVDILDIVWILYRYCVDIV